MQFEGGAIVLEHARPAEEPLYRGERLAGGRFRHVGVGATRDGVTVSIEQPPPPAVGLGYDEIERRISDTESE